MPSLVDQATQKAFKQNVTTGTGLGGQIMAKTMQEFEKNVLAPIMMKIGTEQALNLPKEQLALAQNLQNQQTEEGRYQYDVKQAEQSKRVADIKAGIESGIFKEDQVPALLADAYGMPADIFNKPDSRKHLVDGFVQEIFFKQGTTPTREKINEFLAWSGQPPVSESEWISMFGQQANQLKIEPTKISNLIAKLDAGQLGQAGVRTAVETYGLPHDSNSPLFGEARWTFRDDPQTRARITELYTTNPDFRAWFDTNA
jgi:hypothetical protein